MCVGSHMLCHMMLNYVPFTVMVTTNRDNIIYIYKCKTAHSENPSEPYLGLGLHLCLEIHP